MLTGAPGIPRHCDIPQAAGAGHAGPEDDHPARAQLPHLTTPAAVVRLVVCILILDTCIRYGCISISIMVNRGVHEHRTTTVRGRVVALLSNLLT